MPAFYLDTSALAKRYKSEPGSDVLDELFANAGRDPLVTSYLSFLDTLAIARRLYSSRELTRRGYEALLGTITDDFLSILVVQPLHDEVVNRATEVSRDYGLEGSDALQVATALLTGATGTVAGLAQSLGPCVLVSSDRRMLSVYRQLGGQGLDPEAEGAMELLRRTRGAP